MGQVNESVEFGGISEEWLPYIADICYGINHSSCPRPGILSVTAGFNSYGIYTHMLGFSAW